MIKLFTTFFIWKAKRKLKNIIRNEQPKLYCGYHLIYFNTFSNEKQLFIMKLHIIELESNILKY